MKHVLFIYNPVAGMGMVKKNLFEIADFYDQNGYLVTLCPIRKLNEYYDILGVEKGIYDTVVCSGGDGTLNLTVSFFKEKGLNCVMGYVPAGSTNDYAYSLGITGDFKTALMRTIGGQEKYIDLGQFNEKYFMYVAAFGAFTKVAYSTSQKVKNVLGHTAYILEGIKHISELKTHEMVIHTEERTIEGNFILGLVTNTLSVGGFKGFLPEDVALDDGKFEIIFIRTPANLIELNGIARALLLESLENNPYIEYCKTSIIKIEAKEEIDWTLDGEYGGNSKEVEIKNLQKEISIIV